MSGLNQRMLSRSQSVFRIPGQKTTMVKNTGAKTNYKMYIEDILDKIPGTYHGIFMEWVNMELVKNMAMRSKKTVSMSIPPIPDLDVKTLRRMNETYDENIDTPGTLWLEFVRRAVYRIEYHIKA